MDENKENLAIWEKVRAVPATAQKKIMGGRLSGKTDINPIWRIKTLTEQFGVCGVGWKAPIVRAWTEVGGNGEIAQYCHIQLFVKNGEKWSEGIDGVGGSMLVTKEKNGNYTNDEAIKMAYTDAISVACKSLGFGADIYWEADRTKYDDKTPTKADKPKAEPENTEKMYTDLETRLTAAGWLKMTLDAAKADNVRQLTAPQVKDLLARLEKVGA